MVSEISMPIHVSRATAMSDSFPKQISHANIIT